MKVEAAFLVLLTLGAGHAIARDVPVLSVAEVVAQQRALDHRLVRVRGWIGVCHGRGCSLYETQAGARGQGAQAGWLSIGMAPDFDRQVRPLGLAQIEMQARVRAVCFNDPMPEGVVEVCADRVDQLQQPRLIRVLSRSQAN